MEQRNVSTEMLELMVQPCFSVRNGKIHYCNGAAAAMLVETGTPIASALITGREDYDALTGGCLYLKLELNGQAFGACVVRMQDEDIFLLDPQTEQAELKALSLAARELREPLANIMITAERLFPSADSDPKTLEHISRMNRGMYQILRMVSNMSDAGRLSNPAASRQETEDMTAFMKEVFSKAEGLVEKAGLRFCYEGPDHPVFTLMDRQLLERAALNMVSNAVKFTEPGGSIQVKLTHSGSSLRLSVQDDGCGIDQPVIGSIFHRYLRQPALEDSRYGIGLGMVLIRSAAASHGGAVLIDHPCKQGTRVTMTMAVRQSSNAMVRSRTLQLDYAGEQDHAMMELSDCLPASAFLSDN